MTLILALRHFSTAYGTVSFGGSISEIRPTNVKSAIGKFNFSAFEVLNSKFSGY
jgi:hypothetical protein